MEDAWILLDIEEELEQGELFHILVPEAFGGAVIEAVYAGDGEYEYGTRLHDLYELIAGWNEEGVTIPVTPEGLVCMSESTLENRYRGMDIIHEEIYHHELMMYPPRLVTGDCYDTYELFDAALERQSSI